MHMFELVRELNFPYRFSDTAGDTENYFKVEMA